MNHGQLRSVVRCLRGAAGADRTALTDRELLDRFARDGDEVAFSVLVRRHGAFVMDVCRRVLRGWHDAEDAMQATFLVLARKAGAIAWGESVAGWLHEVAVRVASEARRKLARRRAREQLTPALPETTACAPETTLRDLTEVIDQELRRLPDVYRAPLILCYLEGRSRDEAAEQLGWSLGAVKGRLERGREMLRRRLLRRGLTLSAVLVTLSLTTSPARAALPAGLVEQTLRLAGAFRAGKVLATGAAAPAALAERIVRGMLLTKLKAFAAVLVALAIVGSGVGFLLAPGATLQPPPRAPVVVQQLPPDAPPPPKPPPEKPPEDKLLIAVAKHKDTVRSIAFAPDGRTLAAASWDRTIGLWDPSTGEARRLCPSIGQNSAVAFSPDGKTLFTGSPDGSVSLWDFATGQETLRWQGSNGHIYATAFSPDGKTVAAACQKNEVLLWDTATGRQLQRLGGHSGRVWSVAFAPDGELIASAAEDRTVRLWDRTLGHEHRQFRGHEEQVHIVQFSPDGRTLVSGDAKGRLRLWEAATGKSIATFGTEGDVVQYLALSPDGALAASAHRSGKIRLWSARTGEAVGELPGHEKMAAYCVCFSPDGKRLASSSMRGDICVWTVAKGLTAEKAPAPPALTADELPKLWHDLAADEPAQAFKGIQRLVANRKTAVPFLKEKLKTIADLEAKRNRERQPRIARWIVELDDNEFTVREHASESLLKQGPESLPALRRALKSSSAEVRRRALELFDAVLDQTPDADTLRGQRALLALEVIGDPASGKVLEAVAADAGDSPLGRDAKAALKRLGGKVTAP